MNIEDRLREAARSPVDQPGFAEIERRADRRRRRRRTGAVGALAAVIALGAGGAVAGMSLRSDDPQSVATMTAERGPLPTPTTGSVATPRVDNTPEGGFPAPVGDRPDPPTPSNEVLRPCDGPADTSDPARYRLFADLDGDGQAEAIEVDDGTPSTVTVCDSVTVAMVAEIGTANDPGRILVLDVEGDGVDELAFVAPTGSRPLVGSVYRLVDGQLSSATEGFEIGPPVLDTEVVGASFRCDPNDGIVPLTYRFATGGATMEWSDDTETGSFRLPTDAVDAWLLASGTCGDVIVGALLDTNPVRSLLIAATQPPPIEGVISNGTVELGFDDELLVTRTADELADPSAWVLDADVSGWGGDISALETLASALERGRQLEVSLGPQDHCASPPIARPQATGSLTQLTIQPIDGDSCLQWFAVNLFVEDDFTVRAITLELWEP